MALRRNGQGRVEERGSGSTSSHSSPSSSSRIPVHRKRSQRTSMGYILEMETKHGRFLPKESRHAFAYPLIYLLVDLDDLERGNLDVFTPLGVRLFGYDNAMSLLTIRPRDYIRGGSGGGITSSIKYRLMDELVKQGCDRRDLERDRIFLLTMPRLLNYAFNPVSFYYIYDSSLSRLKWVILEVNNTFDERHLYINKVDTTQAKNQLKGYEHVWTFKRQFHVSPFNDRSGYYQTKFNDPLDRKTGKVNARISIGLIPELGEGENVKLVATLAGTGSALTGQTILHSLRRWPFDIFLTFPRILLQAWKLQYRKGLDVFPKPDPLPKAVVGVGLKWQELTSFEQRAKEVWGDYLQARVDEEMGKVSMRLVSSDPAMPAMTIVCRHQQSLQPARPPVVITLTCKSASAFVDFWTSESPREAYLLGNLTEGRWSVDRIVELEELVGRHSWTLPRSYSQDTGGIWSRIKRMTVARERRIYNRWHKSFARESLSLKKALPLDSRTCRHPVEAKVTLLDLVRFAIYIVLQVMAYYTFTLVRARFVRDMEPWMGWERYRKVELARQKK